MSISFNTFLDMSFRDGSDETIRRLADDLGRHRLTDVQEENEDDVNVNLADSLRRKRYSSIGSTASSMDYLWELHPRRLSEAGLSRHSDNSTILTEDTDSFIIGQKVWVGGTKPGTIAYIGDTQFAPGEWAGIVLDQPIGKNDGSVGGTRYFQCEPKKGVFSRLTRLTRFPLTDEMGSGDTFVASTPLNNGVRRSPISPTGSNSLFKSPPSLNTSNTSLASTHVDFKMGDRVIIKSSQGSKIGTLRYIGLTSFAQGEWCGVELDEPRGKNDGSVEGKRYFECRPNFGLFAPVSKVSRSPSSRKPSSCIIHSGSGIPPSGFRRANSKESLTSNTSITSAASGVRRVRLGVTSLTTPQKVSPKTSTTPLPTRTALQEVLKEKQQHIEQLLKERDLERAEIARAASQADEAEQKWATLKQEYDQYRTECEKKLQEHLDLLAQLKNDREELVANLEDEKRKNEDLQFKFEEAAITKGDLERKILELSVTNDSNVARIKELEESLASERLKAEALETESNKLFEAEEALVRVREENEVLKYEVEVAASKILAVESECETNKDSLNSLQKEVNELRTVSQQKDETIDRLKNDVWTVSEEFKNAKINFSKEIEEYKSKIQATDGECVEQKSKLDVLRSEMAVTLVDIDEKTKALEKLTTKSKALEDKLNKDLDKLKMELSAKNLDLEGASENVRNKEEEIKALKLQLDSLNSNLEHQSGDLDNFKENMKIVEENLKKDLEDSRASVKAKIGEVEELKKEFTLTLAQKDNEIRESGKTIKAYLEDIEKLNASLSEQRASSSKSAQEIQDNLKAVEERLGSVTLEVQKKTEELLESSKLIAKLQEDVSVKNVEVEALKTDLETTKKTIEDQLALIAKSTDENTQLQLDVGQLKRALEVSDQKIEELVQHKTKLENEVQSLIGSSGDFSTRLEELTKELREKENAIEVTRKEFADKLEESERCRQEFELKHNNVLQKAERDKAEYDEKVKSVTVERDALKQQHDTFAAEHSKTVEDLNVKIKELQNGIEEKEQTIKKTLEDSKRIQDKLQEDLGKTSSDLQSNLSEVRKKLDDLTSENKELIESASKKSIELIEAEAKHNQLVEQSKQVETELRNSYEEQLKKLEGELKETANQKEKSLETVNREHSEKIEGLERVKQELEVKCNSIIEEAALEKNQYEEKIRATVSDSELLKQKYEQSTNDSSKLVENLNSKIKELESVTLQKDQLILDAQEKAASIETRLKEEMAKTSGDLQTSLTSLTEYQQKIAELSQANAEIKQLAEQKSKDLCEIETKYNNYVEFTKQNENQLKASFEEQIKKLKSEISEKENRIQQTIKDLELIKSTATSTESSSIEKDDEIEQLKSELQINHQFVAKLQAERALLSEQHDESTRAAEEKSKECSELTSQLAELTEQVQKTSKMTCDLELASNCYVTILQLLQLSESQKIELVDKLEAAAKDSNEMEHYPRLCKLVDGIKVNVRDVQAERIAELEAQVDKSKKLLQNIENKSKAQESEIIKLQNELWKSIEASKVANGAVKVDNSVSSKMINNNPHTNEQLLEEKLYAESQVTFLNSIIVDMQKKNEDQKARIEILESGFSPAAADELKLLGLTERKIAPRMYCDICEEFDLHETEDCPQQASEDAPARDKGQKEKPAPRAYCEICESKNGFLKSMNSNTTLSTFTQAILSVFEGGVFLLLFRAFACVKRKFRIHTSCNYKHE